MNRKESPWTAVTLADQRRIGGPSGSVGACVAVGKGQGREAWGVRHPATALPARHSRKGSVGWEMGHVIRFDHWTRARALHVWPARCASASCLSLAWKPFGEGSFLFLCRTGADCRRVTWGLGLLHAGVRCITFWPQLLRVAGRVVLGDRLSGAPLAA